MANARQVRRLLEQLNLGVTKTWWWCFRFCFAVNRAVVSKCSRKLAIHVYSSYICLFGEMHYYLFVKNKNVECAFTSFFSELAKFWQILQQHEINNLDRFGICYILVDSLAIIAKYSSNYKGKDCVSHLASRGEFTSKCSDCSTEYSFLFFLFFVWSFLPTSPPLPPKPCHMLSLLVHWLLLNYCQYRRAVQLLVPRCLGQSRFPVV